MTGHHAPSSSHLNTTLNATMLLLLVAAGAFYAGRLSFPPRGKCASSHQGMNGGRNWSHDDDFEQLRPSRDWRILYLTDFVDLETRMDPFLYDQIDAAMRHPRIKVSVWGRDWLGWDGKSETAANLQARFSCNLSKHFDIIYVAHTRFDDLIALPSCPHHASWQQPTVVYEFGDCHDVDGSQRIDASAPGSCTKKLPPAADVVLARYGHELLSLFLPMPRHLRDKPRLYMGSLDCAPPLMHPRLPDAERTEVALIGSASRKWYPLRFSVHEAIKQGLVTNGTTRKHKGTFTFKVRPGAKRDEARVAYDGPQHGALYLRQMREQYEEYAKQLGRARICVFDSVIPRKMIRKYAEALMSGCVVAADVPVRLSSPQRHACGVMLTQRACCGSTICIPRFAT